MADSGMDLDGGEAPADTAALGTSVARMVAAAATGNATGPMMAQEVDLLSFIPFHSLMGGEMICSRSASSAGSSGSGHSGGSAISVASWWSQEDDASMSGSESLSDSWDGASDDEELGTDAEGSCQGASDDEDMAGTSEESPTDGGMVAKKPKDAPWCKGGNKHVNSKRAFGKLHPTHQVLAAAVTHEELAFLRLSRAVAVASHMARLFSSSGHFSFKSDSGGLAGGCKIRSANHTTQNCIKPEIKTSARLLPLESLPRA